MSGTMRCFIAIGLSQEVKKALSRIEDDLKKSITGVKWVEPDNIHLTLKFLGNIGNETAEEMKGIMKQVADEVAPFRIKLSSPGAFPSIERPRVLWIGIENTKEIEYIGEHLSELGEKEETQKFHPHLTIARVKFLKDVAALKNAFTALEIPPVEMTAEKITLFQSTLKQEGPVYTALHEVGLG